MSNLALIYPDISKEDYDTIQDIRRVHDPKYFNVVAPHVTLVFPTTKLTVDELSEHVRNKLSSYGPFALRFDSAKVVEDDSGTFFHTFLIPSAGYDEVQKIHDVLYTDQLASELRHDIPFIPHLGIGTSDSREEAESLAREINDSGLIIEGSAKDITIVQYEGSKVTDLGRVALS